MVITTFFPQKSLAAYDQQLTIKTCVLLGKAKELAPKDVVTISIEGKNS
jgi:hypothetical protein